MPFQLPRPIKVQGTRVTWQNEREINDSRETFPCITINKGLSTAVISIGTLLWFSG